MGIYRLQLSLDGRFSHYVTGVGANRDKVQKSRSRQRQPRQWRNSTPLKISKSPRSKSLDASGTLSALGPATYVPPDSCRAPLRARRCSMKSPRISASTRWTLRLRYLSDDKRGTDDLASRRRKSALAERGAPAAKSNGATASGRGIAMTRRSGGYARGGRRRRGQ